MVQPLRKFLFFYAAASFALVACNSNSAICEKTAQPQSDSISEVDTLAVQRSDNWLTLQQEYADRRKAGVNFYGLGNDGDWTLTIDEDSLIRFASKSDDPGFEVSGQEGSQPADVSFNTYFLNIAEGTCSIRISPGICENANGKSFPYSVKVSIKPDGGAMQTFDGCGLYLNDPGINDIWALKSRSKYPGEKLTGNPYVEFNLRTKRFHGNLGCGDLQGYLTLRSNKIRIHGLDYVAKNVDCESETAEQLFQFLCCSDLEIKRDGTELTLTSRYVDTLVFRKVD